MNPQLQAVLQQAISAFHDGNCERADLILQEVLQKDINSADAVLELGIAYAKANRFMEASAIFCCLRLFRNNDVRISYNLGLIHSLQGRHLLALEAYDAALKIQPNDVEVLINKGSTYNDIKDYILALQILEKAIQIRSDIPEAWFNKGIALNHLNLYQDSINAYDEAIKLNTSFYEAWSNKSTPLNKLKLYTEALNACDKALSLNPDYVEAWYNKGNTLYELKRYDEAIAHYDKALSLKPDYVETWSNKGLTLYELKRYDEAITHYDQALSLKSDYAKAWFNKGLTLHDLKRYDEALAHYDKALSLKPNYAEAWSNKGVTLNELKCYNEALDHYEKALRHKPDIDWIYGDLLHIKMIISNWSGLTESLEDITKRVITDQKVIQPFALLGLNDDAQLHKKSAEIYAQDKYPLSPILGSILKLPTNQKIRVGYFSADFKNHAVSVLTAELFELHDKNRFEIIAFSFGANDKSLLRLRLSQAFNQFIDVSGMSDLEIAKLSRELHIDIAIDLGGHTQDSRTRIFSYRAAPIQASYIGYLGTMGAEYYDYLLADKIIIPDDSQHFYLEKIAYLPSYQVNDRKRTISEKQFTREELGLPETGFVFCCFNNNYKILPSTFDGWMRILNAVEGSVFFLYTDNKWSKTNLIKEAGLRGVDTTRLIFGERIPSEEYLARYRVCDLFLDTFPYNAGTTASDALWAGLPVLTRIGQSFASRMAASLLNAVDLPELITRTQEQYENLAVELANDPQKLEGIKLRLAHNRLTTQLFDTPLFTKNLEAAYIQMYRRYKAGLEPEHFFII
jgi:protein O-GlcNAc transferase